MYLILFINFGLWMLTQCVDGSGLYLTVNGRDMKNGDIYELNSNNDTNITLNCSVSCPGKSPAKLAIRKNKEIMLFRNTNYDGIKLENTGSIGRSFHQVKHKDLFVCSLMSAYDEVMSEIAVIVIETPKNLMTGLSTIVWASVVAFFAGVVITLAATEMVQALRLRRLDDRVAPLSQIPLRQVEKLDDETFLYGNQRHKILE